MSGPVKIPSRDVINFSQEQFLDEAIISNLLFESIGGVEMVNFTRHDTVEGENPTYSVISNLSSINRKFKASDLISKEKTNTSAFTIFGIVLDSKLPNGGIEDFIGFDEDGNLVIELVNIGPNEEVQVEIDTNGTIYEVGTIEERQ